MKRFLLAVFAALLCINEACFAQDDVPFDATTLGTDGDVIAFVGKKVFVQTDETWPPENSDIIYMDGRYQARYQIKTLVSGDYDTETIDFHAYDHYGMPRFSYAENVLIFIHNGPNTRWHSKYNFYEVHRTSDGDWAACGNAYVQNDPKKEEKEPLEVIPFLDAVQVDVTALTLTVENQLEPGEVMSDADREEWQSELDERNTETEGLYQAPIWIRNGSKAICRMGTRVADLYQFQNENRFLPDKREVMCRARYLEQLDALGNDYEAERALIDDCTSLLKIQNLP